jgi:hypothetical protein
MQVEPAPSPYLRMLPEHVSGNNAYYPKISGSLNGALNPNLIYSVGGGVFIHILVTPGT